MSDPVALEKLLNSNLKEVPVPAGYASLREKLISIRPKGEVPVVKESPENTRRILTSEW